MAVYLDSYRLTYTPSGGAETDLTVDLLAAPGVRVAYGITGAGPLDRIASTGRMTFDLDNSERNSLTLIGCYSPGHGNCRAGWGAGVLVRLYLSYDSAEVCRFRGVIPPDGISITSGVNGARRVSVTVLDAVDLAASQLLNLPGIVTYRRMAQVIDLVTARLARPPALPCLDLSSNDVFPTVFDTAREKTAALAEISKVALSEMGFVWYQHRDDRWVCQGRYYRSSAGRRVVPSAGNILASEAGDDLLAESGLVLVTDNGPTFLAELNTPNGDGVTYPATVTVSAGKNLYNQVRYSAYPRKIDGSAVVLWSLTSGRIAIAPGQTISGVYGRYRNPTGGAAKVSGANMIAPVATTDYTMVDAAGSSLTANLSVTAIYGAEAVSYSLTNTHATSTGYVNKLQARGYGVYIDDPLTLVVDDAASQAVHGVRTLTLDQRYQTDLNVVGPIAAVQLSNYKTVATRAERVSYTPNYSAAMLAMFCNLDVGDGLNLSDRMSGIVSQLYFIQAVEFAIQPGGVIRCDYTVKAAGPDTYALWILGVTGKTELGVTTYLVYS